MSQADDLTAERAAATLLERMGLVGHPADAQFIGDIIEFRRQTRQEALREAARVADEYGAKEWDKGIQDAMARLSLRLDRLASEGG